MQAIAGPQAEGWILELFGCLAFKGTTAGGSAAHRPLLCGDHSQPTVQRPQMAAAHFR